jgi:hypothetical protein
VEKMFPVTMMGEAELQYNTRRNMKYWCFGAACGTDAQTKTGLAEWRRPVAGQCYSTAD